MVVVPQRLRPGDAEPESRVMSGSRIASIIAACLVGNVLRLVPRRWRFVAARELARVAAPALGRIGFFRRRLGLDDGAALALRMALRSMVRWDCRFDPDVTLNGADLIDRAYARRGAVLFACAHFGLNFLFVRYLFDRGCRLSIVVAGKRRVPRVSGTRTDLDAIPARGSQAPLVFLRIRKRLSLGHAVLIDVDSKMPMRRALPVATPDGVRYVSEAVFHFAARTATPVLFACPKVGPKGGAVVELAEPAETSVLSGELMARDFAAFLSKQTWMIATGAGLRAEAGPSPIPGNTKDSGRRQPKARDMREDLIEPTGGGSAPE